MVIIASYNRVFHLIGAHFLAEERKKKLSMIKMLFAGIRLYIIWLTGLQSLECEGDIETSTHPYAWLWKELNACFFGILNNIVTH